MKNKGFALVELVMAMAVVGVLTSYSMVMSSSLDSTFNDAAARRLMSDLRYTQQLAKSTGQMHMLTFDYGTSTYKVVDQLMSTVPDPVTRQPLVVDLSQYNTLVDFPLLYVSYQGDGTPAQYMDKKIELLSMSGLGISTAVCVVQYTGAVFEYNFLTEPLKCRTP